MAATRQAFVGVGSNLGDRVEMLAGAFEVLAERRGTHAIVSSSIYETRPQGVTDQPLFLNAVFGLETTESPEELLAGLLGIEQQFGRVRRERWGPRTLDLDLLLFEGEVRSDESLQLPHPRIAERAFVLIPLREILRTPPFDRLQSELELRGRASAQLDEVGCRRVSPPFAQRLRQH